MNPYQTAFQRAVHFGLLTGVEIPDSKEPVPEDVLSRLAPDLREHARGLGGYRQVEFVGGRLALQSSLRGLGREAECMPNERGGLVLPQGVSGSISHKRTLAVALTARASHGGLGVDLENLAPERDGIAERVLLPEELAAVRALPEENQWVATLLRFSFKEAIYKALNPFVPRYIGFEEAMVTPDTDQTAIIELRLAQGEGPFQIEGRYLWLTGRVVTMVRVREGAAPPVREQDREPVQQDPS